MEKRHGSCWCCVVLGILVIVFAWVNVSWSAIALTVIGALMIVLNAAGICCCGSKKGEDKSCCA